MMTTTALAIEPVTRTSKKTGQVLHRHTILLPEEMEQEFRHLKESLHMVNEGDVLRFLIKTGLHLLQKKILSE